MLGDCRIAIPLSCTYEKLYPRSHSSVVASKLDLVRSKPHGSYAACETAKGRWILRCSEVAGSWYLWAVRLSFIVEAPLLGGCLEAYSGSALRRLSWFHLKLHVVLLRRKYNNLIAPLLTNRHWNINPGLVTKLFQGKFSHVLWYYRRSTKSI